MEQKIEDKEAILPSTSVCVSACIGSIKSLPHGRNETYRHRVIHKVGCTKLEHS